jgi:acyl carrier protein
MARTVCTLSGDPVDGLPTRVPRPVSSCSRALVCDLLASHLDVEAESIDDTDGLDELGLDPLDMVLVVLKIEDLCGGDGDFPLAELPKARTVADFVALVDLWVQEDTAPYLVAVPGPRGVSAA